MCFSSLSAQNNTKLEQNSIVSNQLLGLWDIQKSNEKIPYTLYGEKLTKSPDNLSNPLLLELYFIQKSSIEDSLNFNENLINRTRISRNSPHLIHDLKIPIQPRKFKKIVEGDYQPVVVLKNKKTKEVLNYKLLENSVTYKDDLLFINRLGKSESVILSPEKGIESVINMKDYQTTETIITIPTDHSLLTFFGNWNLNVDFKTLMVNVNGEENGISNHNNIATNPLKIIVFFSKNKINNEAKINGYPLVDIDVKSLKANTKLNNLAFKTNILKLIPRGTYYPMLVLLEKNNLGELIPQSVLPLDGQYTY